jgi:DNA-binding NarL/FixJ family response regulator
MLEEAIHTDPSTSQFGLVPIERQVLAMLMAGYSHEDIAQKIGASRAVAERHSLRVRSKLGAANRLEMALIALQHGLFKAAD